MCPLALTPTPLLLSSRDVHYRGLNSADRRGTEMMQHSDSDCVVSTISSVKEAPNVVNILVPVLGQGTGQMLPLLEPELTAARETLSLIIVALNLPQP